MTNKTGNIRLFFLAPVYLIVILFLVLYIVLAFNARLTGDDFFYLWLRNTFDAWNGMMYQYYDWSGRWTAHYIACKLISGWSSPFFLPIIFLITLSLLYSAVKFSIKRILRYYSIELSKTHLPLYSVLFIASFFFTSYGIGESWFWYIIVITYLWSLIAFIFSLGIIFSYNHRFFNYVLIALLSAYSGGASESFALIFLFILITVLLYRMFRKHISLANVVNMKILFALVFLATSFAFALLAPGTEIRLSMLPETSLSIKLWVSIKSFGKYFVVFLPEKIPYFILLSFPWVIIGHNYIRNRYEKIQIRRWLKSSTIIFIFMLAVIFIPTSFVMSETGPDRALLIVSFLSAIYFSLLFSLLGALVKFEKSVYQYAYLFISACSIIVLSQTLSNQYRIATKFSAACDARMREIRKAFEGDFEGVLNLDKIPEPGFLYWEEISADTSYFTNKHVKNGLDLPFAVKLIGSEI